MSRQFLAYGGRLNESPSEKEGKCIQPAAALVVCFASMKAPPKRKGNVHKKNAPHR